MEKEDFLLMVVAAGGSKPLTPVQLQKSLFLVAKNLAEAPEPFYEFEPYHYGPFDIEVYSDADSLEAKGLLFSVPSPGGTWLDRAITPDGMKKAEEIEKELSEPVAKYLRDLVAWVQSLSFSNLVKSIYDLYPDYRKNSVFQD